MLGLNKELEEWFLDPNPYPSICKALEMDGLFGHIFSKALIEEKKNHFSLFSSPTSIGEVYPNRFTKVWLYV